MSCHVMLSAIPRVHLSVSFHLIAMRVTSPRQDATTATATATRTRGTHRHSTYNTAQEGRESVQGYDDGWHLLPCACMIWHTLTAQRHVGSCHAQTHSDASHICMMSHSLSQRTTSLSVRVRVRVRMCVCVVYARVCCISAGAMMLSSA